MDQASKMNIQKRKTMIFVGPEILKNVDAGTQLQRRYPMQVAITLGQPSNSTIYIQICHTLQIQGVVTAPSFSMQP